MIDGTGRITFGSRTFFKLLVFKLAQSRISPSLRALLVSVQHTVGTLYTGHLAAEVEFCPWTDGGIIKH